MTKSANRRSARRKPARSAYSAVCGPGLALLLVLIYGVPAGAGWYTRSLPDSVVVDIRGETADTAALNSDRYVEDNLDWILAHNEWVVVNFSSYWCPDSDNFAPGFRRAAAMPKFAGLRWGYAEIDGTRGNESFRERFDLPGIPVVILFRNGEIVESGEDRKAILDGHKGDKTFDDLMVFMEEFYRNERPDDTQIDVD